RARRGDRASDSARIRERQARRDPRADRRRGELDRDAELPGIRDRVRRRNAVKKCEPTRTPEDIDIAALREKYRQERDKRLRAEGARQFLHTADGLADFFETDPYSPPVVRDPISRDVEVVVIGGGLRRPLTPPPPTP